MDTPTLWDTVARVRRYAKLRTLYPLCILNSEDSVILDNVKWLPVPEVKGQKNLA